MYNFVIGQTYTFNTLAPAILGANFQNVKLVAILDYNTAMKFNNVAQQNQVILPLLPKGTPTDPSQYVYLLFSTQSNTTVLLAYNWIDPSSIAQSQSISLNITVNNVGTPDITTISNALSLMGYTTFKITSS